MQDALLRAYRKLGADDRPMTLKPWLYRLTLNRCLDEPRRQTAADLDEHRGLASGASTAGQAETAERLHELMHDIRALPPRRRSTLVIRELDGGRYRQVAHRSRRPSRP